MKIKILFDKDTKDKRLHTGWGVSFLAGNKILFDTGENGPWLVDNMRISQVDMDKIGAVVISHNHWDHTGGLWELLDKKQGLTVYACPNFSAGFKDKVKKFKGNLKETKKITEISKDIFITGEIAGEYKGEYMPEQAMVAKTEKGITVVTGCAHPGVLKMVKKAKTEFPNDQVYLVFGGFHLMDKDAQTIKAIVDRFKDIAVKKVAPTHCSGRVAEDIFKLKFKNDFLPIKAGTEIAV